MSMSILKRTLELEEIDSAKASNKKIKKSKKNKTKQNTLLDDPLPPQKKDTVSETVKLLNKFSKQKVKVDEILEHHKGRLSRDQPKEDRREKQKEESVFTEEDFAKFEAEYFVKGSA